MTKERRHAQMREVEEAKVSIGLLQTRRHLEQLDGPVGELRRRKHKLPALGLLVRLQKRHILVVTHARVTSLETVALLRASPGDARDKVFGGREQVVVVVVAALLLVASIGPLVVAAAA